MHRSGTLLEWGPVHRCVLVVVRNDFLAADSFAQTVCFGAPQAPSGSRRQEKRIKAAPPCGDGST
jgi:hypothetical protein